MSEEIRQQLGLSITPGGSLLLYENGKSDRLAGKRLDEGWSEICEEFGWNPSQRTPAREKYEDGWYGA